MIEILCFTTVVGLAMFAIGYVLGENVGKGKAYREELFRKTEAEENNRMTMLFNQMRGEK